MTNKQKTKIGKLLSLVLRHKPEAIHLTLDENGWCDVDSLIEQINTHRDIDEGDTDLLDIEILEEIVRTNNKQRFSFNENYTLIRANQGHTVNVDLGLQPETPPKYLYHGTTSRVVESIIESGINKGSRNHLHLSIDKETAINVGKRHIKGSDVVTIFTINTFEAHKDGILFYCSENGVWLTEETIPFKYVSKIEKCIGNTIADFSFLGLYRM